MYLILVLIVGLFSRCALGFDTFKTQSGNPIYWHTQPVSWTTDGQPQLVHDGMAYAVQSWPGADDRGIVLVEASSAVSTGVSVIAATKSISPEILAYTTVLSDGNGGILRAVITLNTNSYDFFSNQSDPSSPYFVVPPLPTAKGKACIECVLLHELGHALGMDHSDKDPANIVGSDVPVMNSIATAVPDPIHLHPDDVAGIQFLYPAVSPVTILVTQRPRSRVAVFSAGSDAGTQWEFGDGTTGTGASVKHRYDARGTYEVMARVSDGRVGLQSVQIGPVARTSKVSGVPMR